MRRRFQEKSHVLEKLQHQTFHILVRVQYIFIKCKIKPTEINLIFVKFLILLHFIQEIQLISQSQNINELSNVLGLLDKHTLNFINFSNNVSVFILLSLFQILFSLLRMFVYYVTEQELGEIFFRNFILIHHNIFLLPIMNLSLYFLASGSNVIFSLLILILAIISELEFCFFNIKNSLIGIELCYSKRIKNLIYLICYFIICYSNNIFQQYYISQSVILFQKAIEILDIIHNYNHNSKFYQETILFVFSYAVTLLLKQNWIFTLTVYLLLQQLCLQVRLRKIQIEMVDKKDVQNLFKYNLLDNPEFFNCFEYLFKIFQQNQQEKMSKYELDKIKHGKLPEKLLIILQVFRYKKIQLYLNLINIQRDNLTYLERVILEANLMNVIKQCQDLIFAPPHIEIFIKSLEVEQRNLKLLIDLIDQKVQFYNFLIKEVPINQYLSNFRIQINKIIKQLSKTKNKIEKQYNIEEVRLLRFNKSDQVSINIVKSFISIFYNNYFKVLELEKKEDNLLVYDKLMNQKILKNEAMLISISYIKNQFTIINKGNKRLMQVMGLNEEPDKITQLLPSFQINFYGDLISQYIFQGFEISQPTRLYLEVNSFLVEYELYLYSTISNEDIILHNYLVQKNMPSNFTLFDQKGQILGISKEIYLYFTQKCENQFTQALQVRQFISQGMIQYYVPEIYSHLFELINIMQLEREFRNSITISSRWQFPINHKKCLESASQLGLKTQDINTPTQFKKIFYSSSAKQILEMKASEKNDLIPTLKNIKITMLEQSFMNQIKKLVVPASRLKSLEYQGTLEFQVFRFIESEYHHFILRFNDIEEFKQNNSNQVIYNQKLINNEAQYEGLLLDYVNLENSINSPQLFTLLKYDLVLVVLMIIVSLLALIFDYNSNQQATLFFQESINFLQCPQAMTFCTAEPFLLNWFNYCKENKLYDLSPFIEFQIKNTFVDTFLYCDSVQLMYSLNLSQKNTFLQSDLFNMTSYVGDQNETLAIDMFELYSIILELIASQYHNFAEGQNNPDYTIFKSDGLIRQNLISIFEFHNQVLNQIIDNTNQSFTVLQQKNYMILVYLSIGICILLLIFGWTNYRMLKCQEKIIKLFRFFNSKLILDYIEQLNQQKDILQRLFLSNYEKFDATPTQKQTEQLLQSQNKVNTLRKIEQYHEKSVIFIALPIAIGSYLIAFAFGAQLVADLYSSPYQDSLIMTMRYLKLKNYVDQSIIIGELIKTEQYIQGNNISLINQAESIQFFDKAIDELQLLSNEINNELVITKSYNSTFKQRLINIFDGDLCKIYPYYLIFCDVSQIPLPYYPNDDYSNFVQNGVYGIIQEINKLRNQEYSYEITHNAYQYDLAHSVNFLHSQTHQQIFLSIYLDIEKSIYYSFVDLFDETQILSDVLLLQILIYLLVSTTIFVSVTIIMSGLWIKQQFKRMNQVKLIVTMFPPQLLHQKGFKNLLYLQLIKIK